MAGGQAVQITERELATITPYERNPRKNDNAVEGVARSIKEFGFQQPIVVDSDGVIVIGHTRYKAAQRLGLVSVPVHVADNLSVEQITALRIADNSTGEAATWDMDLLPIELASLRDADYDLAETGLDTDLMAGLLDPEPAAIVEDEVPEPPAEPVTKPGDLWILGEHRLLCGDSTKVEDVARLMAGAKADAVLSDPPYGVSYVGKTKDALVVHNDGADTLGQILSQSLGFASEHCVPGGVWYIAAPPGPQFLQFALVLEGLGIWRQTLVWAKQSLVMGHSDYHYQHEAVFYGWKPGAGHKSPPDRKQTTLWHFDRPTASREHPTMKPVALFAKMLENSTTAKSLIHDPFLGSGTTLIAAEQLNRKCYGMEISPAYCDVIVKRWETLTGRKAELAAE